MQQRTEDGAPVQPTNGIARPLGMGQGPVTTDGISYMQANGSTAPMQSPPMSMPMGSAQASRGNGMRFPGMGLLPPTILGLPTMTILLVLLVVGLFWAWNSGNLYRWTGLDLFRKGMRTGFRTGARMGYDMGRSSF